MISFGVLITALMGNGKPLIMQYLAILNLQISPNYSHFPIFLIKDSILCLPRDLEQTYGVMWGNLRGDVCLSPGLSCKHSLPLTRIPLRSSVGSPSVYVVFID